LTQFPIQHFYSRENIFLSIYLRTPSMRLALLRQQSDVDVCESERKSFLWKEKMTMAVKR
jgi:hypothetical protein